jgi:hypothetical protein
MSTGFQGWSLGTREKTGSYNLMTRRQKEGPTFENRLTHCYTKDNIEISVIYICYSLIINSKAYNRHTDPGKGRQVRNVGWRDKLQRQIERAIAGVLKHYRWSLLQAANNHKDHIERQIKNCLNQNYQDEAISLATKGLMIRSIGLTKISERSKLY